ncbi:hypothetical protein MTO96_005009 [Rhipicephalus appendiculatus]
MDNDRAASLAILTGKSRQSLLAASKWRRQQLAPNATVGNWHTRSHLRPCYQLSGEPHIHDRRCNQNDPWFHDSDPWRQRRRRDRLRLQRPLQDPMLRCRHLRRP